VDLEELYQHRFDPAERARKAAVWQVLCRRFFERYVRDSDTVLDLGAGMCEFINTIRCRERIAVDVNPAVRHEAGPGVRVIVTRSDDLGDIAAESVDVVFASNFLEHLPDKNTLLATLRESCRVLRCGGRMLVLQPNIRVLGGRYWDFFDHHIPLSDRSLVEALELVGLRVVEVRPRFLPYTTKSSLPQHPFFIHLYLSLPLAHRLLGGQAWVVAKKT
jgi:SAM-dependent methyltransferase